MELHVILVYLSVIVMPDGELKALTRVVDECPPDAVVQQMHKPLMDSGEIVFWSARCTGVKMELKMPTKGTNI